MIKKCKEKQQIKKYRKLILPEAPTQYLSMCILNKVEEESEKLKYFTIGLSIINDIVSKSKMFNRNNNFDLLNIPMSTKYLQLKYGSDYSKYTRWLVSNKIIWKDKYYEGYATHFYLYSNDEYIKALKNSNSLEKGLKESNPTLTYCQGIGIETENYSFDNQLNNSKVKNGIFPNYLEIKLPITKENRRFLVKNYEQDSIFIHNASEHIKKMGSHFRKNFSIDSEKALAYCREKYYLEVSENPNNSGKASMQYASRCSSIYEIDNGRMNKSLRFSRNSTNNRIDTNLTNMASDLRIFINGIKDLVYLDLVNSQPVLFNILLLSHENDKNSEEIIRYRNLTINGQWYNQLQEIFNVPRDRAKKIWMEIAYSQNSHYSKIKKTFSKNFPYISSIISKIKEDNYANFAISLQKIESRVFIDKISKSLVENGIIPYTVHDGLFVPKKDFELTLKTMNEILTIEIGDTPVIDVKYFDK